MIELRNVVLGYLELLSYKPKQSTYYDFISTRKANRASSRASCFTCCASPFVLGLKQTLYSS